MTDPRTPPDVLHCARALVDRLRTVHADPTYRDVWDFLTESGHPYAGPRYDRELAALEQALRRAGGL